jgi:hypothetical protein
VNLPTASVQFLEAKPWTARNAQQLIDGEIPRKKPAGLILRRKLQIA